MRPFVLTLVLLAIACTALARGQQVVQQFSGTGGTTTAMFTVGDRWEVRWNARAAVSVAALSSNGTLVAGGSGVLRGSLFVPAGGQYYLKITDGTSGAPKPATNAPPRTDEVPSEIVPEDGSASAPATAWHVSVVQLAPTVSSTDTLTVYAPYFSVPDSAITAAPAPPAPPQPVLTPDQANALVTIKGDNAQGSGFLLRQDGKAWVAAHLRLLAANPNLQLTTNSGTALKILGLKAASDRNLVLINVEDDHLTCLEEAKSKANLTDYVIIPVIGQQNAIAAKVGRIINFEQERIDFDAPVDLSSNSAPVIAAATGKVIGIVTAEKGIDLTDTTAQAWPENPAPGAARIAPFFGLSLADVPDWKTLDLAVFDRESDLLKALHATTRALDGYLNGSLRLPGMLPAPGTQPPDSRTYVDDSRLWAAIDAYHRHATDADKDQQLDAARELLDDLQSITKSDADALRTGNFAYAINRRRAQEELAYRQSLVKQLNAFSDDIASFNTLVESR